MLCNDIINFYSSLEPPGGLPGGIDILYPQKQPEVIKVIDRFYKKYYSDNNPRTLLFGINPGRYGAGITGINFTAPKQLSENCGITHPFKIQSELSAEFIYETIERFGGAAKFYARFFISSICPLGFIKAGVNLNYYDEPSLQKAVEPFIIACINRQLQWNVNRESCLCIGGEKNFKFFTRLNQEQRWFGEILPLPHPRFIMQYRRKTKEIYLSQYLAALDTI